MVEKLFAVAVLLAVVNTAIVNYLAAPIKIKFPTFDLWFLVYVSFVTGAVIGAVAGVNLFADIEGMPVTLGRILTAACIGGGANLLHDMAKRRNEAPGVP